MRVCVGYSKLRFTLLSGCVRHHTVSTVFPQQVGQLRRSTRSIRVAAYAVRKPETGHHGKSASIDRAYKDESWE
jgi:hypothetical protein